MDKTKQKKPYDNYNNTALETLVSRYGVSKVFIRASIRGDRHSRTAIKIADDYKILVKEVREFINNQ